MPSWECFEKDKNRINGLSIEYAGLIGKYIKEFSSVEAFLAAPENFNHLRWYEDTVTDLDGFIRSRYRPGQPFDDVLERIFKLLIDRDYDLKINKRLTRTVLYYMYWNCDLGSDRDD